MTPEAQQIAIAEACGWHSDNGTSNWPSFGYRKEEHFPNPPERLPDYLIDLNAMHEAEKMLVDWVAYRMNLSRVVGIGYGPDLDSCDDIESFVSATASQRAEAFLRTIGKWEDSE